MKSIRVVSFTAAICLLMLPAFSQKRDRKPTTVRATLITKYPAVDDLPTFKNYGYLMTLSLNGEAKVEVLSGGAHADWTLSVISSIVNKDSIPSIIVLKADPRFEFQRLKPWLDALRGKNQSRLKMQFDDNMEIIVPAQITRNRNTWPNPLFLKVNVEQNSEMNLNGESLGNLADPEPLLFKLRNIFKARADNGVFRLGTAEIDSTVFIEPSTTMTVAAIGQLAQSIREVGSDRIGLWLDSDPELRIIQTLQ